MQSYIKFLNTFIQPTTVFICIFVIYILGYFSHAIVLEKTVYGDGIFYFSWLHSIVFDHDVDFQNEYTYFDVTQPLSKTGILTNKYTIGPTILWLPSYLVIRNIFKQTGYELPYQIGIGVISVLYCITGLILLYRLLCTILPQISALLTIVALAFATHLLFYGSLDPVNSHSLSFFATALFLTMIFQKNTSWIFVGASLGLVGIIRPQDMIIGIYAISSKYWLFSCNSFFRNIRRFSIGFFIPILIQLLFWKTVFGQWVCNPYAYLGEGYNVLNPKITAVLFNPTNGLFLYTPIIMISLIGLFYDWKQYTYLKPYILGIFILELYFISSWSTPLQGASYSGRMFIGILPILALPLGFFIKTIGKKLSTPFILLSIIAPLSIINVILILYTLLRLA